MVDYCYSCGKALDWEKDLVEWVHVEGITKASCGSCPNKPIENDKRAEQLSFEMEGLT